MPTIKSPAPGIEARPSGRYRVQLNRRGVRRRPVFTDLGQAITWRIQAIHAIDHDLPLPPLPEEPARPSHPAPAATAATVEGAARRLLAGIERGEIRTKTGTLYKPATTRKYEEALRLSVIPRLGGVKVMVLKRGEVQRMVDAVAAGHGVEQAVNALTALRVVIRTCERYGEIDHDPCAGVRVPRSTPTRRAVPLLTPEECEALVEAAERDDQGNHLRPPGSFIAPMVRLGLDTGLRFGEVLGLRWGPDGIDLEAGLVRVTQSIDRKLDPTQLAYRVIEPKSEASRRRHGVPLSPETVQVMRAHRLATGRPADGALVWAQEDGRPVPPQGKARSAWRRVRKAAGLADLRFHDLRHNFATHQLASGTSVHATADLLGHSDAGLVLRRYGHSVPEEVATAATRMAAWRASQRTTR